MTINNVNKRLKTVKLSSVCSKYKKKHKYSLRLQQSYNTSIGLWFIQTDTVTFLKYVYIYNS